MLDVYGRCVSDAIKCKKAPWRCFTVTFNMRTVYMASKQASQHSNIIAPLKNIVLSSRFPWTHYELGIGRCTQNFKGFFF